MHGGGWWFLLALSAALIPAACNRGGDPPPVCSLPDSGEACTCPGSSVCTGPGWLWSKCLDDGTWEKTDASCVAEDTADAPGEDATRQANPGSGDAAALIPCPPACGPNSD